MRHVRLHAECLRPVDQHQQLGHVLPTMHSAPADLTFGGQPLSVAFCDRACFTEGFGDPFCVTHWIFRPLRRAARGVNANDSVWSNTNVPKLLRNCTGLAELREEVLSLFSGSHRRAS